jgi:hypothetical protein
VSAALPSQGARSLRLSRAAGVLLALACGGAAAQQAAAPAPAAAAAEGPALGKVLQEVVTPTPGKPSEGTRSFKPLPQGAWRFEKGEYRSGRSGLTLRLPRLRDEKTVSVREAVTVAEGKEVRTSHVVFVPDAEGLSLDPQGPVSAVVVTRLRQDRPHDRETVLKAWEPRTPEQRKSMEARGIEFHRIQTGLGEGLERIVPNRIVDANFPYRTHSDEGKELKSVGVTRYLVSTDQALLEFSQVFPCRELAAEACKAQALKASDRFVQGVSSFVLVRSPGQPQGGASAPRGQSSAPTQAK